MNLSFVKVIFRWPSIVAEILKLDESCISDPKSDISDWTAWTATRIPDPFEVSDFGSEMQDSSDFTIPLAC
jgi:hypothetical protein